MNLPPNPFTPETHCHRLYGFLLNERQITTKQIHRLGVETARIRSDIRPFLRSHGLDYRVLSIPGEEGNRLYQIVGGEVRP